jgi:hypothetical protein
VIAVIHQKGVTSALDGRGIRKGHRKQGEIELEQILMPLFEEAEIV